MDIFVSFPIIGVDFLRHFKLMVDPAANALVDKCSRESFATISSLAAATAADSGPPPAAQPAALIVHRPPHSPASSFTGLLIHRPPQSQASSICGPGAAAGADSDGEKLAVAKKEFLQMERDGIVQRSNSPWSSPLHMVRKPDGS